MKFTFREKALAVLIAMLLVGIYQHPRAQQNGAQRIQHDPTMLHACTPINATAAVASTVTLTIPAPPAGQYIYLCGLDITVSFNTGGPTVGTNVQFTSTNLNSWQWKTSYPGAASTTFAQPFYFSQPVKAPTAGTAVTIVSPASNATGAYNINGYYYYAP